MSTSDACAAAICAPGPLERFLRTVLADPALLESLAAEEDATRFVQQVVDHGRRLGLAFTAEDVQAAMQAQRRQWIERWTVR